MNIETIQEASLLLLFDGLDAFHQVLLSLCVRVQRLVLRDHAQIRTDLLVHLQKTHHTLIAQPTQLKSVHYVTTIYMELVI